MNDDPDRPLSVLVIEDDAVDVMAVQRAFAARQGRFTLTVARDGREGLSRLRGEDGHPPIPPRCLILLDLNLPLMNGLEFLRELRRDLVHRRALVFVLTTSDADQDRYGAYDHNVAGYVIKSKVGHDLAPLVDLLLAYDQLVEFP